MQTKQMKQSNPQEMLVFELQDIWNKIDDLQPQIKLLGHRRKISEIKRKLSHIIVDLRQYKIS